MKRNKTVYLVKISLLSCLAAVLMLFDFPVFFSPSFYELDFSEIPVLLGTFSLGPVAGVIIEFLKIIIKLLIKGTSTAYVGEIANFVIGVAFILPAGIIYKKIKSKKGAIIGLITGTLTLALLSIPMNAFVLVPFYSEFYKLPMDVIIGMGTKIIPLITDMFTFAIFAVFPFNLFKGICVSVITLLVYKHLSPILHK